MLMRLLPLVGGLLLSRGSRRMAGRHAGKLTLALGAWELYRAYKASKGPVTPGTTTTGPAPQATTAQSKPAAKPVRRKKRWI